MKILHFVLLIILAIGGVVVYLGVEAQRNAKFHAGQKVVSVLDGRVGQIVKVHVLTDAPYLVRFATGAAPDGQHISAAPCAKTCNGRYISVAPYAGIWMREFELEAAP